MLPCKSFFVTSLYFNDIVTLSIAEDDVVIGETPVILVQPTMEKAKVEVDTGKAPI